MRWKLTIADTAEKQIGKLDKAIARKVKEYLVDVCKLNDPADRGHALTGPLAGLHRYRIGQIRIIARIDRNIITIAVVEVGKRDSIY